jgi:RNA polymerase sigma-70 factor (ECF subfamily)
MTAPRSVLRLEPASPTPPAADVRLTVVDDERNRVARIRAGDTAAFEALFREYFDPLCGFVVGYVGAMAIAEEIVQEVFLRVWANRAGWTVTDSVRSYLYGAARNRALNARKRAHVADRGHQAAAEAEWVPGMGQPPESADAGVRTAEFSDALARALARLPSRCRETFLLRRQHGLSVNEIARTMGVTAKCVERQLTKAMHALRADLADFA